MPQPFRDFWAISYRNHANRGHPGRERATFQICSIFFFSDLEDSTGCSCVILCPSPFTGQRGLDWNFFPTPKFRRRNPPPNTPNFFVFPPGSFSRSREPLDQHSPSSEVGPPFHRFTSQPCHFGANEVDCPPQYAILAPGGDGTLP